jgi:hypothetical protein
MAIGFVLSIISAITKKPAIGNLGFATLIVGAVTMLAIVLLMQNQQIDKGEKAKLESQAEIETSPVETIVDGWSGDVSDGAQMVLRQIAEDTAKQIAQNPSTVKMSLFSAGYAKNGHLYAVQQEFSCSNLMGVPETHIVKVVCESNEDESKIQPFEVWLDGEVVFSQERKYVDSEG